MAKMEKNKKKIAIVPLKKNPKTPTPTEKQLTSFKYL